MYEGQFRNKQFSKQFLPCIIFPKIRNFTSNEELIKQPKNQIFLLLQFSPDPYHLNEQFFF